MTGSAYEGNRYLSAAVKVSGKCISCKTKRVENSNDTQVHFCIFAGSAVWSADQEAGGSTGRYVHNDGRKHTK